MKTKQLKKLMRPIIIYASGLMLSSNLFAADNPKPSSWRNIVVKATETYGNNQSRPLRGAKVIIELENPAQSQDYKTRFPQTKTSGPRGATFTRMPPSSIVGKYVVTVIPKPNDKAKKYSCEEKSISFIHNTHEARKQFNFKCQLNRSGGNQVAQNDSNSENAENPCKKVRIQLQEGRRQSAYSTACQQKDGSWEVKSFKF